MSVGSVRTPKMVALTEDDDHYHAAYKAYAGFAHKKLALYEKWGDEIFVPQVAEKLRASFPELEELNILGVGSGPGEVDICLLERLAPRFPIINNDVIEPSGEMICRYKDHLDTKKPALSGVKTNFQQTTIQEFRRSIRRSELEGGKRKLFHFIHVVHSIYYATDIEGAILDLFESLEDQGIMLVITSVEAHILNRISVRFPFIETSKVVPFKQVPSSSMTQVLRNLHVPFTSRLQKWRTDVALCFDPDSETGNMILDFLTHTVHFRVTAPPELRENVTSFLRSLCSSEDGDGSSSETSEHDDGDSKFRAIRDWEYAICVRTKKTALTENIE